MSALGFLTAVASADVLARSPMEPAASRVGARWEVRGGWNVAIDYGDPAEERRRLRETVGFVDHSALRKLELTMDQRAESLGQATLSADGTWVCPVTPTRTLQLGGAGAPPARAVDLTCSYAALSLVGPGARELLARFCALDMRPARAPVGAFRPGSIARTPGYLLHPAADELLLLVGWAFAEYLWQVVADAAGALGGGPAGHQAYEEHRSA